MRMLRLSAAVALLAALWGAPASAQVAPAPLLYGEELSQPTSLGDETLIGSVRTVGRRSRYSVLSLGAPGAAPAPVFTADVTTGGDEQLAHAARLGYAASATHLAVVEDEESVSPLDVVAARLAVGFWRRVGPPALGSVLDCVADGALPDPPPYAVDGDRLAVLTQHCGSLRLLVHQAGTTRAFAVPPETSSGAIRLAGPYVAYRVFPLDRPARVVVARADTGEEVFAVESRVSGFALAPDGRLYVSTTDHALDRFSTCLDGQLHVASPADPTLRRVPGARPCDRIELDGDRVVFREPDGMLRALAPDGTTTTLARVYPDTDFDPGGGRVAVLMPSCAGGALHSLALDGSSGLPELPGTCTARLLSRT
ncbi:MAG: PQQ-like beta-propeller repeat protein, partial [Actinomycetota bacterium]|nr:PQQ-like beta-propeller repeat protein [Actinomycetota bacterium]